MPFTVACAQFAPEKAEVVRNLDRIAEIGLQAASEGVDLAVFPETATTGYFLEGGVLEASLEAGQLHTELAQRLGSLDRPLDLLVGFYERSAGHLYNSAAYLEFGPGARVVHVYRKFFLPTYGVFDEERFVSRGHELGVFDTRLGRMGVLICEDVWHSILPALSALNGAATILVPSASPARGFAGAQIENLDRYRRLMQALSEEHGVYSVNCHLCGFEGGKGFAGGSMIIDPMGRVLGQSPVLDEHLLVATLDPELVAIARSQTPLLSDLRTAWSDIRRLVAESEA